MAPPLVAVAHGSRDPRSAATVAALVDVVRAQAPTLDVRTAFLDLSAPRLPDVLAALHGAGHRDVVVVPLLLGKAFHARSTAAAWSFRRCCTARRRPSAWSKALTTASGLRIPFRRVVQR